MDKKQLWDLIDEIDSENTRIEIWLSNLSIITNSIESASETLKCLTSYTNALFLTMQGIAECQAKIRATADQAFQLAKIEKDNAA